MSVKNGSRWEDRVDISGPGPERTAFRQEELVGDRWQRKTLDDGMREMARDGRRQTSGVVTLR